MLLSQNKNKFIVRADAKYRRQFTLRLSQETHMEIVSLLHTSFDISDYN